MINVIHIVAEPEPPALHGLADPLRVFGVHLALEVTSDEDVSDEMERDAEQTFEEFAVRAPLGEFHLYRIEAGEAHHVAPLPRDRLMPGNPPGRLDVMKWLLKCRDALQTLDGQGSAGVAPASKPRFFVTPQRETADMRNARAVDLLRASARWPAPVAQHAGLTSALVADAAGPGDEVIVFIPVERGMPTKVEVVGKLHEGSQTALYHLAMEWEDPAGTIVETFETKTPLLKQYEVAQLSNGLRPDGSVDIVPHADPLHRLVVRIEDRASSLLWPTTILGTIAGIDEVMKEFQPNGQELFSPDGLRWFIRASVVTLFDPSITGLLLPVSNEQSRVRRFGEVLGRLTRLVAGTFEAADTRLDVDERKLYLNLHERLWEKFATWATPETLLPEIVKMFPDPDELGRIKASLGPKMDAPLISRDRWMAELDLLSAELAKIAQKLESEEGVEGWLWTILDETLRPSVAKTAYTDGTNLDHVPDLDDGLKKAFAAFRIQLNKDFDAAAAMRRDFGTEALTAVLDYDGIKDTPVIADRTRKIREAIRSSNTLWRRLDDATSIPGPPGALDRLWLVAPKLAVNGEDRLRQGLGPLLESEMASRLDALVADPDESEKTVFRPDDKPQALMMPIASAPLDHSEDLGTPEIQSLGARISGLGFLVRAYHPNEEADKTNAPVHVSLVGLEVDGPKAYNVDVTVDATIPTAAPGSWGMFIPYSGSPLSSPGQLKPGSEEQPTAMASFTEASTAMSAFAMKEAIYTKHEPVPTLAYGLVYGLSAFWVPSSGLLPSAVSTRIGSATAIAPFLPKAPGPADSTFWPSGSGWACLRRTAISETPLAATDGTELREDSLPGDVHPISFDDPRIALEGLPRSSRWRDIYRAGDRLGALGKDNGLPLPKGDRVTVELHEVMVDQDFDIHDLIVDIMTHPDGAHDRAEAAFNPGTRTISLHFHPPQERYWLRLQLASGQAQALSFADPMNEKGQANSDRKANLLLLAPGAGWTRPSERTIRFSVPLASIEDVERWGRNTALWSQTCGSGNKKKTQDLLRALREARALFEVIGDPMKSMMHKLPDPAVSGFLIGAAFADWTVEPKSGRREAQERFIPVRPYNPSFLDTYKPILTDDDHKDQSSFRRAVLRVKAFVNAIFQAAEHKLSVVAKGSVVEFEDDEIRVPVGTATHLWITPAVDRELFETSPETGKIRGIFDPRMKQLAVGSTPQASTDYLLFDGVRLVVEAMAELTYVTGLVGKESGSELGHLPSDVVSIRLHGTSRSFSVDAAPALSLRLFSRARLSTQQWSFTGRPIYHWIDPTDGKPQPGPVVPLGRTRSSVPSQVVPIEVGDFETDAFGTRGAEGNPRLFRLRPAEEATPLMDYQWPERSATYYRFKLEMVSRYGPLMDGRRTWLATADWAARVAVLADLDAAPLARPQLRAFIPLLGSIEEATRTSLTCVLSEQPFAFLGLAGRVCAELSITNRFVLKDDGSGTRRLRLEDVRKQFSPDPRLSYYSVPAERSKAATLRTEGPIGLHFDAPNAPDPAWSNSQYVIHVDASQEGDGASPEEMEESFLGIQLTRFADPGWCWMDPKTPRTSNVATDTWIDAALPFEIRSAEKAPGQSDTYVKVGDQGVEVLRAALFKDGGDGYVTLWRKPVVAVLLKPMGDNRFRLSLFCKESDSLAGAGVDQPRLVSSVIFAAAGPVELSGKVSTRPTRQSEATIIEWARTSRDMRQLMVSQPQETEPQMTLVSALKGFFTPAAAAGQSTMSGRGLFVFHKRGKGLVRVGSPVSRRPNPLHVHRRLMLVFTKASEQVGHQVDLFHDAVLADEWGAATIRAGDDLSVKVGEIELRAEIHQVKNQAPDADVGDRYKTAKFDLFASHSSGIKQLRLHVRAANTPLDLNRLQFEISDPGNAVPLFKKVGSAGIDDDDDKVEGVDLIIYREADGAASLHACWRNAKGESRYRKMTLEAVDGSPHVTKWSDLCHLETLGLRLIDNTASERWVDISILQSRMPFDPEAPDAFDFDWLFGTDTTPLPAAVSMPILNRLPEAQVSLLGLSDVIPVESAATGV